MALLVWAQQLSFYRNLKLKIQICMADCMVKFRSAGFPHNFAKNKYRQDLKMGCIDVSRRQLQ